MVLFLVPSSTSSQTYHESLEQGVRQFHEGYRSWDADVLLKSTETLERACAKKPDDYLPYHWLGIARFHVLVHRKGDAARPMEKREFKDLLSSVRQPLQKAIKLNSADSEAHALISTLAGMEIAREPSHAIWLGPTVLRHRKLAVKHGKDNPRTQYLIGAAFVQGPSFLGGLEEGLPHLKRAEKLFETQTSPVKGPVAAASTWGYEHCLVLIGDVCMRRDEVGKAEEYFRKATAVNPQNKLAQRRLNTLQRSNEGHE